MTDNCKIISVTAESPVVNVSNGAKVATAQTKEVITQVQSVQLAPPSPIVCYESRLTGLGEEWIPDPHLFKYLETEFSLNDYFKTHAFKVLNEQATLSEIRFSSVRKVLAESTVLTDAFNRVWNAFRSFNDSVTKTELLRLHPYKVINDSTTNFEQLTYFVRKNLEDQVTMADLTKIYIQVLSGKFEHVWTSDQFSRIVNYVRIFNDQVDTTDDFYGLANIDDDQYALVYKVLLDFTSTPDVHSIRFTRSPILDAINASEVHAISLARPIQSNANAGDVLLNLDSSLLKLDQVAFTDVNSFVFNQGTIEDIAAISETVANYLIKPFTDQITNTDLSFRDFNKIVNDVINITELVKFELLKTISDQGTVTDEIANAMSKIASDESVAFSETLFKKDIALLIKEEDYYFSDYFFEDYFFKAVHATDQITDVQFTKNIEDIVDATDDFYGSLNVDDDQVASVHKILSTWVSNSDTFSRVAQFYRTFNNSFNTSEVVSSVFNKTLSDTSVILEVVSKSLAKVFSDVYQTSEVVAKQVAKALADSTANSELTYFNSAKVIPDTVLTNEILSKVLSIIRSDVASISETFVRVFVAFRSFNESVSQSDSHLITVGKNNIEVLNASESDIKLVSKILNENVVNIELLKFNYSKQINDIVDATDDFYGIANVDDDQVASVTKVLADYATNTDAFSRLVQFIRSYNEVLTLSEVSYKGYLKPVTETVSKTDLATVTVNSSKLETVTTSQSLTIYNQNYYASNYMVPGYYGEMYIY